MCAMLEEETYPERDLTDQRPKVINEREKEFH